MVKARNKLCKYIISFIDKWIRQKEKHAVVKSLNTPKEKPTSREFTSNSNNCKLADRQTEGRTDRQAGRWVGRHYCPSMDYNGNALQPVVLMIFCLLQDALLESPESIDWSLIATN